MKLKRRLYSLIPLALLFAILAGLNLWTLILLPIGLLALRWYSMGLALFLSVSLYLIYHRIGGIYGLSVISLALLTAEMAYLDRKGAPKEHYLILLGAVLLAFPIYTLMVFLARFTPRLEVTGVAALFLVVLYLFLRMTTD
ncbi:hypothetical protein [Thermococcus sp.]|uniref:hypothetical protein n=1 Tax=Thermococcus sp. TaxID=35749 RepID=UPI0026143487|nr:hypothetical protein [Thermococcus sp.]